MTRVLVIVITALLICAGCANTELPLPASPEQTDRETDQAYIPRDLEDCFVQLKKILKTEDIAKMQSGAEQDMTQYHFGLGMWIRNNWGLWKSSRLAKWFNARGIGHPDDMSGIILESFWRHLNNKPIKLDEQVKYYQDYWNKQETIQPTDPSAEK